MRYIARVLSRSAYLTLTWRRNADAAPSPAFAGYQLVDFPALHYESLSCWSTTAFPLLPLPQNCITRKIPFRFFLPIINIIFYSSVYFCSTG